MNEQDLELKFNQGLFEEHEPSGKISVSSIQYPCLRKAYYTKKYGDYFNIETAYTFWLGKAIHRMEFLKAGEIELEWNGIIGIIDEFEDGTIVEKKTCNELPRSPNDHHKIQLEYYYILALKNKMVVNDLWLLYMEKKYPAHRFFQVKPRKPEVIEEEMIARKEILEKALAGKGVPKRHLSWLCRYCPFPPRCFGKVSNHLTPSHKGEE